MEKLEALFCENNKVYVGKDSLLKWAKYNWSDKWEEMKTTNSKIAEGYYYAMQDLMDLLYKTN